jgi:hypothetical protein
MTEAEAWAEMLAIIALLKRCVRHRRSPEARVWARLRRAAARRGPEVAALVARAQAQAQAETDHLDRQPRKGVPPGRQS